ncbi:MAG TPA: A24 family peptidase [Mycobacteriales bacterium]|nr:A24 family peptidase [Mycobacteriales bacterium]
MSLLVHLVTALCCAVIGLVAGPALASLTVTVPAPGPARAPGWWRGAAADRRRLMVVNALSVVVFAAMGGGIGWRPWLPAYLWLAGTAVALAVIDVDCHRLPDAFTFPAYGAGIVLLGIAALAGGEGHSYLRALICMAAVFVAFYLLAFLGGIGFGDTKLAGALGLYLGWLGVGPLVLGLVAGFCIGAVVALALLAARSVGWKTDVAFGPALLGGALSAVLAGRHLVDAYLGTVT